MPLLYNLGQTTQDSLTQVLRLRCFCCSAAKLSDSETPQPAACQASLSFTISQSLLKLMSIESAMPSNRLILCHLFLLLSSVFPSIRIFSNELALRIRWSKYWSFSFSISPSNEYLQGIPMASDSKLENNSESSGESQDQMWA